MATIQNFEELQEFILNLYLRSVHYLNRVEQWLDILFRDLSSNHPKTVEGWLMKHGYSEEQIKNLSEDELIKALQKAVNSEPSKLDNIVAALDLLFQARYGWPEGSAHNLTPAQVFLALEHAMEYDAPGKPSVWELTQ